MVCDLQVEPPCYKRFAQVLTDVRDTIAGLSAAGVAFAGAVSINDVLDVEHIKSMHVHGAFPWACWEKLMADVMTTLMQFNCAASTPANIPWAEVQGWMAEAAMDPAQQPYTLCKAVEYIMTFAQDVRLYVANRRLFLMAPIIKKFGITYEKGHFEQQLHAGTLQLTRTRAWLRSSLRKLVEDGDLLVQDLTTTSGEPVDRSKYLHVLYVSVMQLVVTGASGGTDNFPEILHLDVSRFDRLHTEFRRCVTVASVVLTVGQKLREVRVAPCGTAAAVVQKIAAVLLSSRWACKDVEKTISVVCAELDIPELSKADVVRFGMVLKNGLDADSPIPKLMSKRMHDVIVLGMQLGDGAVLGSDAATTETFKHFFIPLDMMALAPFMKRMVQELRTILSVNTRVCAKHYNRIIASEAAGFTASVNSDTNNGTRLMTVAEAERRLIELVVNKTITGTCTVRLDGGVINRDGLEWVVVDIATEGVVAPALTLPITMDLVALQPGLVDAPMGYRLVTTTEASSPRCKEILVSGGWLQTWSIARLAGGKIDGSGYGGGVTEGDFVDAEYIGQALVTPL